MRKWMWMMVVAMATVACSSSSEDEAKPLGSGNGQCAQRDSGSYVVKYAVRSGNCGEAAETVLNPGPQPTEPKAPCTGSITYAADNCEVAYSSTCPGDSVQKGATITVNGNSKWSTDATTGSAVESWSIVDADGQSLCQGTYDVTITKQ
jgi:hypothetical protein